MLVPKIVKLSFLKGLPNRENFNKKQKKGIVLPTFGRYKSFAFKGKETRSEYKNKRGLETSIKLYNGFPFMTFFPQSKKAPLINKIEKSFLPSIASSNEPPFIPLPYEVVSPSIIEQKEREFLPLPFSLLQKTPLSLCRGTHKQRKEGRTNYREEEEALLSLAQTKGEKKEGGALIFEVKGRSASLDSSLINYIRGKKRLLFLKFLKENALKKKTTTGINKTFFSFFKTETGSKSLIVPFLRPKKASKVAAFLSPYSPSSFAFPSSFPLVCFSPFKGRKTRRAKGRNSPLVKKETKGVASLPFTSMASPYMAKPEKIKAPPFFNKLEKVKGGGEEKNKKEGALFSKEIEEHFFTLVKKRKRKAKPLKRDKVPFKTMKALIVNSGLSVPKKPMVFSRSLHFVHGTGRFLASEDRRQFVFKESRRKRLMLQPIVTSNIQKTSIATQRRDSFPDFTSLLVSFNVKENQFNFVKYGFCFYPFLTLVISFKLLAFVNKFQTTPIKNKAEALSLTEIVPTFLLDCNKKESSIAMPLKSSIGKTYYGKAIYDPLYIFEGKEAIIPSDMPNATLFHERKNEPSNALSLRTNKLLFPPQHVFWAPSITKSKKKTRLSKILYGKNHINFGPPPEVPLKNILWGKGDAKQLFLIFPYTHKHTSLWHLGENTNWYNTPIKALSLLKAKLLYQPKVGSSYLVESNLIDTNSLYKKDRKRVWLPIHNPYFFSVSGSPGEKPFVNLYAKKLMPVWSHCLPFSPIPLKKIKKGSPPGITFKGKVGVDPLFFIRGKVGGKEVKGNPIYDYGRASFYIENQLKIKILQTGFRFYERLKKLPLMSTVFKSTSLNSEKEKGGGERAKGGNKVFDSVSSSSSLAGNKLKGREHQLKTYGPRRGQIYRESTSLDAERKKGETNYVLFTPKGRSTYKGFAFKNISFTKTPLNIEKLILFKYLCLNCQNNQKSGFFNPSPMVYRLLPLHHPNNFMGGVYNNNRGHREMDFYATKKTYVNHTTMQKQQFKPLLRTSHPLLTWLLNHQTYKGMNSLKSALRDKAEIRASNFPSPITKGDRGWGSPPFIIYKASSFFTKSEEKKKKEVHPPTQYGFKKLYAKTYKSDNYVGIFKRKVLSENPRLLHHPKNYLGGVYNSKSETCSLDKRFLSVQREHPLDKIFLITLKRLQNFLWSIKVSEFLWFVSLEKSFHSINSVNNKKVSGFTKKIKAPPFLNKVKKAEKKKENKRVERKALSFSVLVNHKKFLTNRAYKGSSPLKKKGGLTFHVKGEMRHKVREKRKPKVLHPSKIYRGRTSLKNTYYFPLGKEALEILQKRKREQKEFRAKKQNLERRRQQKRKRFYARPTWLRVRLYESKLLKKMSFLEPVKSQSKNVFLLKIRGYPIKRAYVQNLQSRSGSISFAYAPDRVKAYNKLTNGLPTLDREQKSFWVWFYNTFQTFNFLSFFEQKDLSMLRVFWSLNKTHICGLASFENKEVDPNQTWLLNKNLHAHRQATYLQQQNNVKYQKSLTSFFSPLRGEKEAQTKVFKIAAEGFPFTFFYSSNKKVSGFTKKIKAPPSLNKVEKGKGGREEKQKKVQQKTLRLIWQCLKREGQYNKDKEAAALYNLGGVFNVGKKKQNKSLVTGLPSKVSNLNISNNLNKRFNSMYRNSILSSCIPLYKNKGGTPKTKGVKTKLLFGGPPLSFSNEQVENAPPNNFSVEFLEEQNKDNNAVSVTTPLNAQYARSRVWMTQKIRNQSKNNRTKFILQALLKKYNNLANVSVLHPIPTFLSQKHKGSAHPPTIPLKSPASSFKKRGKTAVEELYTIETRLKSGLAIDGHKREYLLKNLLNTLEEKQRQKEEKINYLALNHIRGKPKHLSSAYSSKSSYKQKKVQPFPYKYIGVINRTNIQSKKLKTKNVKNTINFWWSCISNPGFGSNKKVGFSRIYSGVKINPFVWKVKPPFLKASPSFPLPLHSLPKKGKAFPSAQTNNNLVGRWETDLKVSHFVKPFSMPVYSVATLFFHFLSFIGLISLSQIRCVLKFNLILIYKLSNTYAHLVSNLSVVFNIGSSKLASIFKNFIFNINNYQIGGVVLYNAWRSHEKRFKKDNYQPSVGIKASPLVQIVKPLWPFKQSQILQSHRKSYNLREGYIIKNKMSSVPKISKSSKKAYGPSPMVKSTCVSNNWAVYTGKPLKKNYLKQLEDANNTFAFPLPLKINSWCFRPLKNKNSLFPAREEEEDIKKSSTPSPFLGFSFLTSPFSFVNPETFVVNQETLALPYRQKQESAHNKLSFFGANLLRHTYVKNKLIFQKAYKKTFTEEKALRGEAIITPLPPFTFSNLFQKGGGKEKRFFPLGKREKLYTHLLPFSHFPFLVPFSFFSFLRRKTELRRKIRQSKGRGEEGKTKLTAMLLKRRKKSTKESQTLLNNKKTIFFLLRVLNSNFLLAKSGYVLNTFTNKAIDFYFQFTKRNTVLFFQSVLKIIDLLEGGFRAICMFFEKPAQQALDWIAYSFLVEWGSDMTSIIPENVDLAIWTWFVKNSRSLKITVLAGSVLQRRLFCLFYMVIDKLNQPDCDLITRKRKGILFWDIWADLLMKEAEARNINISSLASIKEERTALIDQLLYGKREQLRLPLKYIVDSHPPIITPPDKKEGAHYKLEKASFPPLINYIRGTHKHSKQRGNKNKPIIIGGKQSNSKRLDTSPKVWHPLKIYRALKKIKKEEGNNFISLEEDRGLNSTRLKAYRLYEAGKKRMWLDRIETGDSKKVAFPIDVNSPLIKKKRMALMTNVAKHAYKWGASQQSSFKQKHTDLFVDLNLCKSFSHVSAIKYYSQLQQPLGSLVCQIYAGLFYKQIAKNVLVIGSSGMEKSLLIEAMAGETEIKIMTDNAHRYALVNRGLAVGIKLLKDVFDAICLQTPCLFLLEDIHAIGERRPLSISDSSNNENTKSTVSNQSAFVNSEALEVHEKNQVLIEFSKHALTHYKKPYKGEFSQSIVTNHFCFDLFLGHTAPRTRHLGTSLPSPIHLNTDLVGKYNKTFASCLQLPSFRKNSTSAAGNQVLSPPSTSPFTVLLLKQQKKLKPKKLLKEIALAGLPGEQLTLLPKLSYSVRVKVALLADLALSNLSAKLDMITDLLVIIDNVRSNRGFVIFATTHSAYSLDPALRRPGRLDETIRVPFISNLCTRWEILKSNMSFFFTQTNPAIFSNIKNYLFFRPFQYNGVMPHLSTGGYSGPLFSSAFFSSRVSSAEMPTEKHFSSKRRGGPLFYFLEKGNKERATKEKAIQNKNISLDLIEYVNSTLEDTMPFLSRDTNLYFKNTKHKNNNRNKSPIPPNNYLGGNGSLQNLLLNFTSTYKRQNSWNLSPFFFGGDPLKIGKLSYIIRKGSAFIPTFSASPPPFTFSTLFRKRRHKHNYKYIGVKQNTKGKVYNFLSPFIEKRSPLLFGHHPNNYLGGVGGDPIYNNKKGISTSFLKNILGSEEVQRGKQKKKHAVSTLRETRKGKVKTEGLYFPKQAEKIKPSYQHIQRITNKVKVVTYFQIGKKLERFTPKGDGAFLTHGKRSISKKEVVPPLLGALEAFKSATIDPFMGDAIYWHWDSLKSPKTQVSQKANQHNVTALGLDALQQLQYVTLYENQKILKHKLMDLLAGKVAESFIFSERTSMPTSSSAYGVDQSWRAASSLVISFMQKRYIYHKNMMVTSLLHFANGALFGEFRDEPPNPPDSNVLVQAKRYENYKRSLAMQEKKLRIGLNSSIERHEQQRFLKKLYNLPVKQSFRSEKIEASFTGFTNAALQLNTVQDSTNKLTGVRWFYQNRILKRHQYYLTNQWYNGQLPEHNTETVFLSDVDWRYTFVESIGDLLIDFPDADQIYNPRQRKWLLNNANSTYFPIAIKQYTQNISSQEIYEHFLMEAFTTVYKHLNQNREALDTLAYKYLKVGYVKEVNLINLINHIY